MIDWLNQLLVGDIAQQLAGFQPHSFTSLVLYTMLQPPSHIQVVMTSHVMTSHVTILHCAAICYAAAAAMVDTKIPASLNAQ